MRNTCTAKRLITMKKRQSRGLTLRQRKKLAGITDTLRHHSLQTAICGNIQMEAEPRRMCVRRAYRRTAGIRHNVINASDQKMSFVEIELKK